MPPETPRTMRRPSRLIPRTRLRSLARPGGSGLAVAVGAGVGLGADELVVDFRLLLGLEVRDDQTLGDLFEGDRQRLAGDRGDLRRDGALPVGETVVVGVDLPGARGAERDEGELRSGSIEELLDAGIDHRVVAGGHRYVRPLGWGAHRK